MLIDMNLLQKWVTPIELSWVPLLLRKMNEENRAMKWDIGKSHVFYIEISSYQQHPYTAPYHKTEFVEHEL